jgi:glyoxylase-like metal-dependent hydrolase (beta-lactamase superfamily II)
MRITLAAGWLVALAAVLSAQQQRPAWVVQQQLAPGAVETVQIRENVFAIFGAGGNVTVHLGEDGVILVDSGSADMADKVLAAVRAITPRPIRMIISTSADADHVGGNEKLATAGYSVNRNAFDAGTERAAVLAHENVLNRMSAPTGQQAPFPIGSWPTETYIARSKSMYLNDDGIQVIAKPKAHSDGDSIVFFRRADVIAAGDLMDLRQFPVVDRSKGGSLQGQIDALNDLLELAIPAMPLVYKEGRTLLVPGHGRISDHAEIVEYRDMLTVVRDRVRTLIGKGMSLQQVKAANPTQGYRHRYGSDTGGWTTDRFVEAVDQEFRSSPQATRTGA